MKKLTAKNLIEFRKKSDRGKRIFVENAKADKAPDPSDGGGDYWTTSLSAVCKAFKQDESDVIDDKIAEVREKLSETSHSITKTMYKRNIDVLQRYQGLNLSELRPAAVITFPKASTSISLLTLRGLSVQIDAKRCRSFTFEHAGEKVVGGIWFIAQVDGYRVEEVGMFCEILYRFLKLNYSKVYQLSSEYCIVVDLAGGHVINYSQIEDGSVQRILNSTLDAIVKLM